MAIHRLLQNSAFEPELIEIMETAYEDALKRLQLTDRADPLTELIARKIIERAQTGERDAVRLTEYVVREVRR